MTKATTKSRRVWVLLNPDGALAGITRDKDFMVAWKGKKQTIKPATLTWTPPAKAKRSAR